MSHIITSWLNDSKLSLRAIAKQCKVTYAGLYNVIAGKTKPNFRVMEGVRKLSNDTITPNDWFDYHGSDLVTFFVDIKNDNDTNFDGGHVDDNNNLNSEQ